MRQIYNCKGPDPGKLTDENEWARLENQREIGCFLESADLTDELRFVLYFAKWHNVDYVPMIKALLLSQYYRNKEFDLSTFLVEDRNKILEFLDSLRLEEPLGLEEYEIIIDLQQSDSLSVAGFIPNNVGSLKLYGSEEIGGRMIFEALQILPKLRSLKILWSVEILKNGMYRPGRWFTFANVYGLRALEEKDIDCEDRNSHDIWTYEISIGRGKGWKWVKSPGLNREREVVEVSIPGFRREVMNWFTLCKSLEFVSLDLSGSLNEIIDDDDI
jgi:hypothetical protein